MGKYKIRTERKTEKAEQEENRKKTGRDKRKRGNSHDKPITSNLENSNMTT